MIDGELKQNIPIPGAIGRGDAGGRFGASRC
jgi:hypothetical protein